MKIRSVMKFFIRKDRIRLIPVIEFIVRKGETKLPLCQPYHINFYEPMNYQENFYEISKLSDDDLLYHIQYRTKGRNLNEICTLYGGYILNVNDEDLIYPQCCSDFEDVKCWIELSKGKDDSEWGGHPWALTKTNGEKIKFQFYDDRDEGPFVPVPLKEKFKINQKALQIAVENLQVELDEFSTRLENINKKEKLGFENISQLLIYGS